MSITELPLVHDCAVAGCSYNADSACHAGAISITGSAAGSAGCGTFIDISVSGGLPTATAAVGACHRTDCTHNDHLECHAESIRVGPGADPADCLTYHRVA